MNKRNIFGILFSAFAVLFLGNLFFKNVFAEDKINICHFNSGKNEYEGIEISASSWSTHQGHGDFLYNGPLDKNGKPENKDKAADVWCNNNIPPDPTPTPIATATNSSEPSSTSSASPTVTATATATPTTTPTATTSPSATPNPDVCLNIDGVQTSVPDGLHLDASGLNCVAFSQPGPGDSGTGGASFQPAAGQVLGTSTMAATGGFQDAFFYSLFAFGSLLTSFGIIRQGEKKKGFNSK